MRCRDAVLTAYRADGMAATRVGPRSNQFPRALGQKVHSLRAFRAMLLASIGQVWWSQCVTTCSSPLQYRNRAPPFPLLSTTREK